MSCYSARASMNAALGGPFHSAPCSIAVSERGHLTARKRVWVPPDQFRTSSRHYEGFVVESVILRPVLTFVVQASYEEIRITGTGILELYSVPL